ncbi:tRNA (guanine-N(1)-)-methyltransferase [Kineosporia sp. NBRC 101677]|uniref:tRNA (guanosine(37)-N1)-methyltransferase TrmD n=1 Tax=Kineosporia sp. NBRC 101677 TaxID=3032197 RepID=UPI0024A1753A|nr:tRNA (guanosine(37)-N1)-methyltransferase TrmD [Kineosporia sp. NBRC 101677]GLY16175.1 tRNA (guanine-N(1)-)-methyltransferase [Kineosporia sp. NBRC 101677]
MRVDIVSIFPEYLAPLDLSLIGKARRSGLLELAVRDLREFTHDRHRTVDDAPAGGGAGMVMKPEPWAEALDAVLTDAVPTDAGRASAPEAAHSSSVLAGPMRTLPVGSPPELESALPAEPAPTSPLLLVPSPSGRPFTQAMARELAAEPWLIFACGRYEGIDERVYEHAATRLRVQPVSLGDYVLNGGEVAVLAIVEAVARLIPGVIGNAESLVEESHEDGLLEYPVYTKPASWQGRDVPPVLMSGHHAQIERWRRDERLRRTSRRRPDLIARLDPAQFDKKDRAVLAEEGWTVEGSRFQPLTAPVAD